MKKLFLISLLSLLFLPSWSQDEADSLLNLLENTRDDSTRVELLLNLSRKYLGRNLDQSIDFAGEAVELATDLGSLYLQSYSLNALGAAFYYRGDYVQTLEIWAECNEVLKQREEAAGIDTDEWRKISRERSTILNNLGVVHKTQGQYDKAIEYYQDNLKIQETVQDTIRIAMARANIANVYFAFEIEFTRAIENNRIAIDLLRQFLNDNPSDIDGMKWYGITSMNMGIFYKDLDSTEKALYHFNEGLQYFEEIDDNLLKATIQRNLGNIYMEQGELEEALLAVQASLDVYRAVGQRKEEAEDLKNLGKIHYRMKNYQQALDYMDQSLEISRELDLKREIYDVYRDRSEVYKDLGNYRLALENYELFTALKDSSMLEENLNQISELETKYETEKVERENVLLNTRNDLQQATIRNQRIFLFSVIGISVIILGFGFVVYRQYREKKRANIQLEEQNIEIKQQRDKIFQQKQEITDSIQYASRIQNAILPPPAMLSKLQEHFILYKPRDIVSGDYYWMTLKDNKTVVAAADCTGHGVPGAFMSMLGISFMNEIVNKTDTTQANEILNQLRGYVISSLGQTGEEGEAQDGMDLALCVIDTNTMRIQYSGAYNPLYLIRDDELLEYKPDKMPIGIHKEKTDPFTNNEIEIKSGDALYMFSDGYVDQFGGMKQKKFMTKNFKELLKRINTRPMQEQGEILDRTIQDWMGSVEQIDDILVMGLRI